MAPAFVRADLLRTSHGVNEVRSAMRYGRLVLAQQIEANLAALLADVLEPVAGALGRGVLSSCYRSPGVNAAVGGDRNSAHLVGLAADWIPLDFPGALEWILSQKMPLERVIYEERGRSRWLHLQRLPLQDLTTQPLRLVHSPASGVYNVVAYDELMARVEAAHAV